MINLLRFMKVFCFMVCFVSTVSALEAKDITIKRIVSPDAGGNMYVELNGLNNCGSVSGGTSTPYFIIQGWGDQTEPALSQRKVMLQIALTAFAAGKKIRASGTICYQDHYLFADSVSLYN